MIKSPGSTVTIQRKWLLIGGVVVIVGLILIWYIRTHGPNSQNAATSGTSGNGTTDSLSQQPINITITPPGIHGNSYGYSGHVTTGAGSGLGSTFDIPVLSPPGDSGLNGREPGVPSNITAAAPPAPTPPSPGGSPGTTQLPPSSTHDITLQRLPPEIHRV